MIEKRSDSISLYIVPTVYMPILRLGEYNYRLMHIRSSHLDPLGLILADTSALTDWCIFVTLSEIVQITMHAPAATATFHSNLHAYYNHSFTLIVPLP